MLLDIPLPACQAGHTPPATLMPQATNSPPVPARAAALAEQARNLLKLLVGLAGAQGHVVLRRDNKGRRQLYSARHATAVAVKAHLPGTCGQPPPPTSKLMYMAGSPWAGERYRSSAVMKRSRKGVRAPAGWHRGKSHGMEAWAPRRRAVGTACRRRRRAVQGCHPS